jgi:CHAT domain-containing protein
LLAKALDLRADLRRSAALKLDADWVILSARNTAGGASGAEALSGLARAFFYAQARAARLALGSGLGHNRQAYHRRDEAACRR